MAPSQPFACRGPRSGTRPSQGGSARWHRPLAARRQAAETKAREEAETKANAVTFIDVAARYIAAHARSSRNAQHAAQWTNSRPTYAAPVFGPTPVAEIDHELVLNVLTLGEQDRDPSSRPLPDRTGAELSQRWASSKPLSHAAVQLLESLPRLVGETVVFPGSRAGVMLSDLSLTAYLRGMATINAAAGIGADAQPSATLWADGCEPRSSRARIRAQSGVTRRCIHVSGVGIGGAS